MRDNNLEIRFAFVARKKNNAWHVGKVLAILSHVCSANNHT